MQDSKTFKLINTLSKVEKHNLKQYLSTQKRKATTGLFDLCLEFETENKSISWIEFYEMFYQKKYSQKDDNTFRNELRILNKQIENFVGRIQIEQDLNEDTYLVKLNYLKFLFYRKSFDLLQKELKKVFKEIETTEDYYYFFDFFMLWTQMQNVTIKIEEDFFNETKKQFTIGFDTWKKEVSIKTRKLELFKTFIDRTSFMVNRNITYNDLIESLEINKTSEYVKYLNLKILAFKQAGDEKIETLQKSLIILSKIKNKDIVVHSEKFTLLQSIGIEYMIRAEYNEAVIYFEQSLNVFKSHKDKNFIKGLYNYLSTLIKLKDFKKAIEWYQLYKDKILSSNISDLFSCIFTMCYVFEKRILDAEQTNLIISSNASTTNYLYSRCNLAIIHYLNSEIELTINELVNINQAINYHKNQDLGLQVFTSIFKQYIQLTANKNLETQNRDKIKKLSARILESIQKSDMMYGGDSLHILWLQNEINNKFSS